MEKIIAIYGAGYQANKLMEYLAQNHKDIKVSCFVESKKTKELFWNRPVVEPTEVKNFSFDYLVVAIEDFEQIFRYLYRTFPEQCGWLEGRLISFVRFKKMLQGQNGNMPYYSATLNDGLSYVYTAQDIYIGKQMLESGTNFSGWQILLFFQLVDKFYGKKERTGVFFDIGANIGTTSIYAKKQNPSLRIIAIEAGSKNFDLLRCNCILNHMDDIETVHMGFGNVCGEMSYHYNAENPGGSGLNEEGQEKVDITTLDKFVSDRNISPEEIDYIWMDTEGHEGHIIDGGINTLSKKRIPLLHEFSPSTYIAGEVFQTYLSHMETLYEHFLDVHDYYEGDDRIYSIAELKQYAQRMLEENHTTTDLFFF